MEFLLPAVTLSILLIAAISDLRTNRIPNILSLIGIILVGIIFAFTQSWPETIPHLWSMGAMFVITMIGFAARWIGGGDAKILTFVALTVPITKLLPLCLWISIMGGLQALYAIAEAKIKHQPKTRGIPYGVAIFLGTLGYWVMRLPLSS